MVWDIHVRPAGGHVGDLVHVKARWAALGCIDDVSLDCGTGVHQAGPEPLSQRAMSTFSRPIEGTFRLDPDATRPEVVLRWSDEGEECEEHILLTAPIERRALTLALRRLVHARPRTDAAMTQVRPDQG